MPDTINSNNTEVHEIFTKDAEDGDLMSDTFSTREVDETTFVIAVNLEFFRGIAERTCLKFGSYKGHELLKQKYL